MSTKIEAGRYITAFECLGGRYQNGSGVFVLGCLDKVRNTLLSQQYRAISLINALDCLNRFNNAKIPDQRPKIAIVGGGVAGVTAAICAVKKGVEVHLFEKNNDVLTLFQGASHRSIHPNLFNWPRDGSLDPKSKLPFLNWEFAPAPEVARSLRDQFNRFRRDNSYLLKLHTGKSWRLSEDSGNRPTIVTTSDGSPLTFDHVIVAVGFGEESKQNWHAPSYWVSDSFTSARNLQKEEFIVVGNGDGGLADCLRLRLGRQDMNFEQQIVNFFYEWNQVAPIEYDAVKQAVLQIEGPYPKLHDSTELRNKYSQLKADCAIRLIEENNWLRRDTKVYLVGKPSDSSGAAQTLYGGWQSPLNRFLITLLSELDNDGFEYVRGEFLIASPNSSAWSIATSGQTGVSRFTHATYPRPNCLILRIGPSSAQGPQTSPIMQFSATLANDAKKNQAPISLLDMHSRPFEYPPTEDHSPNPNPEEIAFSELPSRPTNTVGLIGIKQSKVIRRNPYLLGMPLVGRADELNKLREWFCDTSEAKRIRCICDYGGAGKTALVWAWLTDKETGRQRNQLGFREFWTSFYTRDYGWRNLIRDIAEAIGKKPPEDHELDAVWSYFVNDILEHFKSEKWLLVLDGLEREMEAFAAEANFGADSEEQDARKEAGFVIESEKELRNPILADFLRRLAKTQCKTLITTRIFPRDLEGVAEEYFLANATLTKEQALELWAQQTQIGGSPHLFERFFNLIDFHPQTIGIVAGAVEAASGSIQLFDDWFNGAPTDVKEACMDDTSTITSRRHRWLELATRDLPYSRKKDWILLCRLTGRSNSSNRTSLVKALVTPGNQSLFANEQSLLRSISTLQSRRLLGYDPNSGEIDVHPVVRTVVHRHVALIRSGKDEFSKSLWSEMGNHLDDQELLLKELSGLKRDDRAKRVDETNVMDSRARLDLFRDFYDGSGSEPWLAGLPTLLLRKDQASVDLKTAVALSEIGKVDAAKLVIERAKLLFELNNDSQGLKECIVSQNWVLLYGGSLFDFEKRYLNLIESGDQSPDNIYWLAIGLAIRQHQLATSLLNKLISSSKTRWALQTVAEGFYYLEDFPSAEKLALEAWNKKEEKVPTSQILWEWVTLGLAKLRKGDLEEVERYLVSAYLGSSSLHYRVVRLFALSGLIEYNRVQAENLRFEIDIRPRLNAADRFFHEYNKLDNSRRYPIPASDVLLAEAKVLLYNKQNTDSLETALTALRCAHGDKLGFSYAAGVKRATHFLNQNFSSTGIPQDCQDSRTLREHEDRIQVLVKKFLENGDGNEEE